MEKKISDDHHHDQALSISSSSSVVAVSSSRPSLKIRIRITPEMKKQLMEFEKEEKEAVKQINVKSEVVKEEVEEAEINVKSEVVKVEGEIVKESVDHHHHQPKQELQQLVDCSSSSFELKLEATKRKFHDSYQQIANAKRQRRIQLIDPGDLTKPAAEAAGGKGKSSKLVAGSAKSRILNVIVAKKKTNNNNRYNLFSASRSTLLKPSYIF